MFMQGQFRGSSRVEWECECKRMVSTTAMVAKVNMVQVPEVCSLRACVSGFSLSRLKVVNVEGMSIYKKYLQMCGSQDA